MATWWADIDQRMVFVDENGVDHVQPDPRPSRRREVAHDHSPSVDSGLAGQKPGSDGVLAPRDVGRPAAQENGCTASAGASVRRRDL